MSARHTLTPELRAEVLRLENDLRTRVATLPQVQKAWQDEYDAARAVERTSASWEEWVDERVTLAAVAWVLTTVFIRFCEDNALVKSVRISGPRSSEALEAQQQFLRETARVNPDVTDREWLLQAVKHFESLPAAAGLVDASSPMWLVSPSGDAATRLLAYWRERDEQGNLLRDFSDPDLDTRFLGDLYQDVSEDAKKRYALLQTPVFVEEFILDRTLEPALNERPLEEFKMIDPTCGSGHFLLGGFRRLLDRWHRHSPAMDERERVQAALDSVYGVDINPFALAIARFRLTVAALKACGLDSLEGAPAFKYHLAVGDSLLHGLVQPELNFGASYTADNVAANFAYATENLDSLRSILADGQYDCVVGNPPYITPKDQALSKLYRDRYSSCRQQYALTVPFMERFHLLARPGRGAAGWVGQITSNSFMKREFGSKLIEEFLPTKDIRLVADTSGAYIPGHGTPTVIVVSRNQPPTSPKVRAVLGISGEPGRPEVASEGKVWSSLVQHVDDLDWNDEWVTVTDLDRKRLSLHPWSLTGGGAVELAQAIDNGSTKRLSDLGTDIGRTTHTGIDDAFGMPASAARTRDLLADCIPLVSGEDVRDYSANSDTLTVFPYNGAGSPKALSEAGHRYMWPNRTVLRAGLDFGQTREQRGLRWFDHSMFFPKRFSRPLSLAFAFFGTHNHFALDRGGNAFNKSAPAIKLPDSATEEQHLALLGMLNSSTACFWMKQSSHNKGSTVDSKGARQTLAPWENFYEFTSTTMQEFPLPSTVPPSHGTKLDCLAQALYAASPAGLTAREAPARGDLDTVRDTYHVTLAQMIAEQEELDWAVYRQYGLVDEELTYANDPPELALGERAFEIVLARLVAAGKEESAWFDRHGSTPIAQVPSRWPAAYQELIRRRIELIESHPYVRLLERPEYKRRWATEPWEKQEERALRTWLLDRLEDRRFWFDLNGRPTPKSVAVLADEVDRDRDAVSVLAIWEGRPDVPLVT